MNKNHKKFWFPAKRRGFGWGLANCWQGLVVQIGYVALILVGAAYLLSRGHKAEFWGFFALSTVLLIAIH